MSKDRAADLRSRYCQTAWAHLAQAGLVPAWVAKLTPITVRVGKTKTVLGSGDEETVTMRRLTFHFERSTWSVYVREKMFARLCLTHVM